jgi:hypothetical protein
MGSNQIALGAREASQQQEKVLEENGAKEDRGNKRADEKGDGVGSEGGGEQEQPGWRSPFSRPSDPGGSAAECTEHIWQNL